jgi:hypothetical protein
VLKVLAPCEFITKDARANMAWTTSLPEEFSIVAQVVASSPSNIGLPLASQIHPQAAAVCQDPEAPIVSEHPLWICLDNTPEPKIVVRHGSLIVHATSSSRLGSLLFPTKEQYSVEAANISSNLESSFTITSNTKYWAQPLKYWIES